MTKHAPRNATDTRARILASARVRFARDSFDHVGTRDIAAGAGVDASLVNRYFGGKAQLFEEAIDGVFVLDEVLHAPLAGLGDRLVRLIMDDGDAAPRDDLDALRLLLRAAAVPATAALVSARFHAELVLPLARRLRGRDADVRASVIASYVIGLATMTHALGAAALGPAAMRKVIATAGAAIQACVDG